MSEWLRALLLVWLVLLGVGLYLFPTILAFMKSHDQKWEIGLMNVFLWFSPHWIFDEYTKLLQLALLPQSATDQADSGPDRDIFKN